MRPKRNRLRPYSHRKAVPMKDREGNSYVKYGPPSGFCAEVWPAGGRIQAEMYGQRMNGIRNVRIDGEYSEIHDVVGRIGYRIGDMIFQEGDGICLGVPGDCEPDYKIISIRPYRFLTLEVERIS